MKYKEFIDIYNGIKIIWYVIKLIKYKKMFININYVNLMIQRIE